MKLFSEELVREACSACRVVNLSKASIGEALSVAQYLKDKTGIPFVRMDLGAPGIPANNYGVEAEKAALDRGVANAYPPAAGIPQLKEAGSRFIKSFIDIDISPRSCVPTTGSVQGSFGTFAACCGRIPGKDKVLFIDPGFPIQKSQLKVLGLGWRAFDIYHYRGARRLEAKLREMLAPGDIAAIVYANPDNPAWFCLEEEELKVIGELATEYDAIVTEDLAYFGMDFRKDLGHPGVPPFLPTAARYTDNYILFLSASKIFSYAGQRMALTCISDSLFDRHYPALAERYGDSGFFGNTLINSIFFMMTGGNTSSAQYAYAHMLNLSCDGVIDFVSDTREYERRAARVRDIFCRNGFHIVYDMDVTAPIGNGFYFSLGYGNMTSGELVSELMHYGISCISLETTGSEQQGVRGCVSLIGPDVYPLLEERAAMFHADHS
ncbi:MAG: pyridoxal phosphate-dependent aminotransferase [Bacteroidales bacterium]|nr:pyridoxal phosphate-dependent aminotransferase [Bacteroidales bacterium]